jgi:hypothetical protein
MRTSATPISARRCLSLWGKPAARRLVLLPLQDEVWPQGWRCPSYCCDTGSCARFSRPKTLSFALLDRPARDRLKAGEKRLAKVLPAFVEQFDGWADRDLNVDAIMSLVDEPETIHRPAKFRRRDGEEGSRQLGAGAIRRVSEQSHALASAAPRRSQTCDMAQSTSSSPMRQPLAAVA